MTAGYVPAAAWNPGTSNLILRADSSASTSASATTSASQSADNRPPVDKIIGITLAVASGLFIGSSFVLKKKGLLSANAKYNQEAGEGYGYLKNAFWWTGMTLMIIGEICNFVAYAFTDAIIVTPMGALSVVICAILSAIFLKERLSFVGKVACFLCILGSIIIPLNAPERAAVKDIQEMQHYVIAPGFLSYAGVVILGCIFTALWAGPRYGKKSMLVYLTICSLIGGLSVVATQGLGSAVIAQSRGEQQFNQWFLYVLLVFVVSTLLTEIIYLNKALNIFNAAMVTPTYYVYFTSATIVTSAVLFQGFGGTPVQIITIVLGFLTICSGVVLLQMSNSAKDVPDAAIFSGDLDQMRTLAEQEQPESEPKADTFRGTAGLLRSISKSRRKMEQAEADRILEDKRLDHLEPIQENEQIEWDGLRRRKTKLGSTASRSYTRTKAAHPPLGMSRFPDAEDDEGTRPQSSSAGGAFGFGFRHKTPQFAPNDDEGALKISKATTLPGSPTRELQDGSVQLGHVYGLPPGLRRLDQHDGSNDQSDTTQWTPSQSRAQFLSSPSDSQNPSPASPVIEKRTFSFQSVFQKQKPESIGRDLAFKGNSRGAAFLRLKDATEEERLGLVKNASGNQIAEYDEADDNGSFRYYEYRGSDNDLTNDGGLMAGMTANELNALRPEGGERLQGELDLASQLGRRPLPLTPDDKQEN